VLATLTGDLQAAVRRRAREITGVHPVHRRSAENLVQYLELRGHDVRGLQAGLADLGLSSLGRSEGHVQATVRAVHTALRALAGDPGVSVDAPRDGSGPEDGEGYLSFAAGRALLARNSDALLGPAPDGRPTRIMVTLPATAADDYPLVHALLARGTNCVRINCAHDDPDRWQRMITHVRTAAADLGRPCLVAMDLAGPKLRTGPLAPGPPVARFHPARDALGRVTRPAEIRFTDRPGDPAPLPVGQSVPTVPTGQSGPGVPIGPEFLAALRPGDRIRLHDTRGARRTLRVTTTGPGTLTATTTATTYLATGTVLHAEHHGAGRSTGNRPAAEQSTVVGRLPDVSQWLLLRPGDDLLLTRDLTPVQPPPPGRTARIGCTLPEVFGEVRTGQRVWFDDGKIGAVVIGSGTGRLRLRITDAAPSGSKLRPGKGINLPDTALPVAALTEKDETDLRFVATHADLVSLSFVRSRHDVRRLQMLLAAAGREEVGLILKIETLRGFEHLPELLLTAMRSPRVGVMIARGDLAVECGYRRLAELQEEILWLCEAAHVPVIWATQVLDQLARTGRPTRAEITDAAMAERAECVMLNKGPYIREAVTLLDDVLTRMHEHQDKKVALMRQLRSWRGHPG
jgi:pyruvate kinase